MTTHAATAVTVLRERFGFASLRPGQSEVIDALFAKGAALAVFPTGAGKSLCYQLPALMLEGVTLVVSPLIALMKDQIDFLHSRGIAAARLDSTLSAEEARAVTEKLRQGALQLLYVAPERFNNERFVETLRTCKIALFAVDEAHCISEWGHNFRPDYLKLAEARDRLGAERLLALTATATPDVVRDICKAFRIPSECAVVTGFYRPNLRLVATPIEAADRDEVLAERLSRAEGPGIVYVTLQKTAERVAAALSRRGLSAKAYHAGMEPEARAAVQDAWMASDRAIVVATIAFGMGIDKANVRQVIHYNLPKSLESYSQEIGRAGRDGAASTVELFACPADVSTLENFAHGDTPTEASLRGLLGEIFGLGMDFDVSYLDLSARHDVRVLVVRTALTYLELDGILRQGTTFYAGYDVRPILRVEEIVAKLPGERGAFVADIFRHAKKGRIWYGVAPARAAAAMGQPRERILTALTYLEENGWVELRPSDVRQPYRRLREHEDIEALTQDLARRFHRRETQEVLRIQEVLRLATHAGCQTNALVGHFGEVRSTPCGHCSYCATGRAGELPPREDLAPIASRVDARELATVRRAHAAALGEARQAARFLCGLTSPALTRAKLSRHAFFGVLAEHPFAEVLAFCGP